MAIGNDSVSLSSAQTRVMGHVPLHSSPEAENKVASVTQQENERSNPAKSSSSSSSMYMIVQA